MTTVQKQKEMKPYFGSSEQNFSPERLRTMVHQGEIGRAKNYVNTYFAKILGSKEVAMWCPSSLEDRIQIKKWSDVKGNTIKPLTVHYGGEDGDEPKKWNVMDWFFLHDDKQYERTMKPNKPILYSNSDGDFLNLFPGYLHEPKPYDSYSKKVRAKVERVWKHIFEVWCSGHEDISEYVRVWLIRVITGQKLGTSLLLNSEEGTGKSVIIEFLQKCVLGHALVLSTPNHKLFEPDAFNSQIIGRLLMVLEEPKADKSLDFQALENKLKDFVTGDTIQINTKNIKQYTIKNHCNLIIFTNNNITMKGRRTVALPVSTKYVNNFDYFSELTEITSDRTVGEAFFSYCVEESNKDQVKKFPLMKLPQTPQKQVMVLKSLQTSYLFIKEEYLLKGKDIKIKAKELKDLYQQWCENNNRKATNPYDFISQLETVGIQRVKKGQNVWWFVCDNSTLKGIYEKKNWIHESDEFVEKPKDKNPVGERVDVLDGKLVDNKEYEEFLAWKKGQSLEKMKPIKEVQKTPKKTTRIDADETLRLFDEEVVERRMKLSKFIDETDEYPDND